MKRKRPRRGDIERKFLTSILWVGVIPVALALIIGYVFAREGQQIAVRQSLSSSAAKSAAGIDLALKGRLQMAARISHSSEVLNVLLSPDAREDVDRLTRLLARLRTEAKRAGGLESSYSLYDEHGDIIIATEELPLEEQSHPEWTDRIFEPALLDFYMLGDDRRYAVRFVSPVYDPGSGEVLGYLSEIQGVLDIFEYALDLTRDSLGRDFGNRYEIFHLADEGNFVLHRPLDNDGELRMPRHDVMDPTLAQRLMDSEKDNDSFILWRYRVGDSVQPVIMAYQRMHPRHNLYLAVYRPTYLVYRGINFVAILTLVVSSLVIAFFGIITYRFVNNNIIRPVALLNEGAQIIRHGDLDLKLKIDTGDEIEELASSFNKMATALRHNLNRLAESEERYRSLFNSMRDGIYQADSDGNLSLMNPAGADILGYDKPDELHHMNLQTLFVEQGEYDRMTSELARYRFVERSRVWMRTRDNRAICVEFSASQVFDEGGVLLGMEGSFRDVTQNVRLEREARERSERISAINQIANVINSSLEAGRVFETIADELRRLIPFDYAGLVLRSDQDERYVTHQLWPDFSTSTQEEAPMPVLSQEVAEARQPVIVDNIKQAEASLAGLFPEEIQSCVCVPLHATGQIIGSLNLGAERIRAYDKHAVKVLSQMAPHVAVAIRNTQLVENLQHSLEEVTRARERLHDAIEELKTLDEMKTNLLSNVSHELRTPLVAVMGYNDMIYNGKVGPVNDMQREYLNISLRNIEKLVTLIENLLDFSRLHRGAEELMFDNFDLVDCAQAALDTVKPTANSRRIALKINVYEGATLLEGEDRAVMVEGDKGKLGQVFINLLSNAVKFNEDGGSVTIDIRVAEGDVEISVTDTGIGMPEEALDKIFTRFYQYDASSTRKYGGTGIGLSISQDIMRLHGSRILVSSKVGEGTLFSFTLPLSSADQRVQEGEESAQHQPLPIESHLLVALLSQDRALSTQIRSMLMPEGMELVHASYLEVAVSLVLKYRPDCLLVDAEMLDIEPGLLEAIQAQPELEPIPLLLITSDDALVERCNNFIAGRMGRTFRKSTLLSAIHYALSRGVGQAAEGFGNQPHSEAAPKGRKILCVDDDPEILLFMKRCLEASGYEAVTCKNGEEALQLLQQGGFWLVLLDIAMPDLNGWEVCRSIKNDPGLRHLRVYFVTAKPIEQDPGRVHAEGAEGYLIKPFKADDLLEVVQQYDSSNPSSANA